MSMTLQLFFPPKLCEDNMSGIYLHLHKYMLTSSPEIIGDEDMCLLQDDLSHIKEGSMNNTSIQMQANIEISESLGHTKFSCSLCKKIIINTTELVFPEKGKTSKAYDTLLCSDCYTFKPNSALLDKPLVDCKGFASNLTEAHNELLAHNICSASKFDEAHEDTVKGNTKAMLYFCSTCSIGNISVKDLSNHQQCMVLVQKKIRATDHNYNKKKPLVMNYLLTQHGTTIHIKCFVNSANEAETYLCSLCCSGKQMLISEACDHVKLLSDSVVLGDVVGNKSSMPSHSLLSKHESNISARKKTRYMCVSCGKLYKKQASLVLHMQSHTVEPSPCPHCSKVFMSVAMLNAHLSVHSVFPYKCSLCSQTFLLEPLLCKHLATEHNSKSYEAAFKCKHCNKSFTLESYLDIHLKSHNFICPVCDKTFLTLSALKSHDKCHTSKDVKIRIPVVCDKCGIEFCDLRALRKHLIRQHGESDKKRFVCETCGVAFWEKSELGLHQTVHSEERPFTCDLCHATFKRKNYLASHFQSVHSKLIGSLLDPCITCGLKFNSKKDKGEHLKTHSSLLHICQICNKNLSSKTGLYLHHKYTHERNNESLSKNVALKSVLRRAKQEKCLYGEGPPFSCNQCNKTYKSKSCLYQHRRNVHILVNREYPCNVCGKVYTKAISLYAHRQIHKAKNELTCSICFKVFLWQGSFKQHMNTHSKVKKHHCKYCEKSFNRKFLLDTHTRVHTGEKPYACDVCGRAFAQMGDRNRHRTRHN